MDAHLCEDLWKQYADRLLLYAASILNDRSAAEDALQAVFTRLLAGAAPTESDSAYLFRAIRNESLNILRSRRRPARHRESLFEEEEEKILRDQVETALGKLPRDQREAVVLKIWGDLSFPEGAEVLGVSLKAFEHRYYRALDAIEKESQ